MHFSLVQTVSPNPILCISGWNLIWITDFPHSVSQLFISDLCVHKHSFVFTECELVSIVMPLRCYVYAKSNSNSNAVCNADVVLRHDNMLPSQLCCIIIVRLVRQRQKRKKLECAALFRAAVSATFKTQRGMCTSSIMCFPLDLHFATPQACICKDVQHVFCKSVWRVYLFYVPWGHEKLR